MRCPSNTIKTSLPIDAPWRHVVVMPFAPKSASIEPDHRRVEPPSATPFAWEDDDDEDDEDFVDDEEDVDVGDDEDDDFFDDDDEDLDDEEDADVD